MQAKLAIEESSYRLSYLDGADWILLAVLKGGHGALLSENRLIDEASLEASIERAEDWLMPHAAKLSGALLDVSDTTARLSTGLHSVLAIESRAWDKTQVESFFDEIVYRIARPWLADALRDKNAFVADIMLLRELAHHMKLQEIRLT